MTQLKELRRQAKKKGLRDCLTLCEDNLEVALQGKLVSKRLRRNQVCQETQTDFPICRECVLQAYITHLKFKTAAEKKKIAYINDMEIDVETVEFWDMM